MNIWRGSALAGLAGVAMLAGLAGCGPQESLVKNSFGQLADGTPINIYTLRNASGMEARVMNLGAVLVSVTVPDRTGKSANVVLGYDTLGEYIKGNPYFGAIVGRYANRIGGGRFVLDGQTVTLNPDGRAVLHGGRGFSRRVWQAHGRTTPDGPAVELTYVAVDGEDGFPGTLTATVTYTLTTRNELRLDYQATTDKPTVVNLTNHAYFNLTGDQGQDIGGHVVTLAADKFTVVDDMLIPTGEIRPVKGTALDFTSPMPIAARWDSDEEQVKFGHGYDHNFVLRGGDGSPALAARVLEPTSGRVMEVLTTEPGVQFYAPRPAPPKPVLTTRLAAGTAAPTTAEAKPVARKVGLCLETQHFPDSPNHPNFPSTVLRPCQEFHSTTVLRFSTESAVTTSPQSRTDRRP